MKKNMWQSTEWVDAETGARWWKCRNCPAHYQLEDPPQGLKIPPKILYLDIETSLMKVWLYDLYGERNTHINADMLDSKRFVINWAAAWLTPEYEIKKIVSAVVTPREAVKQKDKRILRPLFELMDAADYICGHNSRNFDVKILRWRFLFHGWGYPSKFTQVDTLALARNTKPESRSLDFLLKQLGHAGKRHQLKSEQWREIVEYGTPKLLNQANRYCRQDVRGGAWLLKVLANAEAQAGKVLFK